jgi:hypothetical protein
MGSSVRIASALASIAVIVLWARSHRNARADYVEYISSTRLYGFYFHRDQLLVTTNPGVGIDHRDFTYEDSEGSGIFDGEFDRFIAEPKPYWFSWRSRPCVSGRRQTELWIPAWFLLLATSLPALLWIRRFRARLKRVRPGHCPHCGYDLRATPDRCPECGREAAQVAGH